ncbi:MAG: hypothetical protein HKO79_07065 [Desulfobacterales bacterium]|nr:hypothetical protein [Desulfobacterales bacterium]NNL42239.1 hypothetical protein [Desulfobacterales bacterium]
MGYSSMTGRKSNMAIEPREEVLLKTKVKHLTNDLRLTKEEIETSTKNYFEIYSKLEEKVEERTEELTKVNKQLNVEIQERKRIEEALQKINMELESRVKERTKVIQSANEELRAEISERKRAERQLQKSKEVAETANRAKSEFLANMGHEFRTPLNHAIGFTELVVDKNFGELNEIQEDYLEVVLQSSKHLLSLINDILDFSRLDEGELNIEPVEVNIKTLFEKTLALVKEKATKKGIQILMDIDDAPEYIRGDYKKLNKALYNLLSNAVKFTPDSGEIGLEANFSSGTTPSTDFFTEDPYYQNLNATNQKSNDRGKFIQISVTDTGIGIKQKDQARIFDAFEQGDGSANKMYQGSGLGLALTKQIVELHQGKIWVESEGEGRGSKFHCIFPV